MPLTALQVFIFMAPINLRRLVAMPAGQASGVVYATIIQHSAKNLHENPPQRSIQPVI
jgi:hypothetical protein